MALKEYINTLVREIIIIKIYQWHAVHMLKNQPFIYIFSSTGTFVIFSWKKENHLEQRVEIYLFSDKEHLASLHHKDISFNINL